MAHSENLNNLHILRGLTALYVVIYHAKFILWCGGNEYLHAFPMQNWNIWEYVIFASDIFTSAGLEMVLIFFVLSGFFIAQSFERNKWNPGEFYLNRGARIYPPYLTSLIFSAITVFWVAQINPSLFTQNLPYERNQLLSAAYETLNIETFSNALYFNFSNGFIGMNLVYWSLVVEIFFYIGAPVFVRVPHVYMLASLVALYFLQSTGINFIDSFSKYSVYFGMGILLFHFKNHEVIDKLFKYKKLILLLSIALFLATVGLGAAKYKISSSITALLFSICSIYFLLKTAFSDNFLVKKLMILGKFSYSLYLFHVPVLLLVYAFVTKVTGQYNFYTRIYWIAIPLAVVAGYGFYSMVEKRSLFFIEVFKQRRKLKLERES